MEGKKGTRSAFASAFATNTRSAVICKRGCDESRGIHNCLFPGLVFRFALGGSGCTCECTYIHARICTYASVPLRTQVYSSSLCKNWGR
ncbi:hypothetical protein POVWA2_050240 [Plasmodium ovale wallikeri]|uniref:Uncharacterized protein n=1 Tax=Plasmodium ovale wallikeri TaxID=864142 RepID=A0A1A8ZNV6_PLAOA|nr:hypothetical protein POVWA2_050240 [Plasmodium ovale wallikeri]